MSTIRRIVVGGVPPGMSSSELTALLSPSGPVAALTLAPEHRLAVATFRTADSAIRAASSVHGRVVAVGGEQVTLAALCDAGAARARAVKSAGRGGEEARCVLCSGRHEWADCTVPFDAVA